MATLLRQVLTTFEQTEGPISLNQMAADLGVEQGMLEEMIQYWVRKGRLQVSIDASGCATCGVNGSCPHVLEMPRSYELSNEDALIPLTTIEADSCHLD
ncbi:MAG: hypothetical protein GYB68_07420 [Chloroflexi bacterium]|nr:hypothetical protein [Chloroflexota bacterium]